MLPSKLKIERIPHQRGIKLLVLPNSTVVLRCSKKEKESYLHTFVLQHHEWIENAVAKTLKLQFKYPRALFFEGESLRLLGKTYTIRHEKSSGPAFVYTLKDHIIVRCKKDVSQKQIRKLIHDFYFQMAQKLIPERVQRCAEATGFFPKKISLRKQKTLWGSCTHQGHIQLNWKLISAPLAVLDYVIVHELCHLKHANHSHRFWDEVAKTCPDYKPLRRWLKQEHYSFDFLNQTSELHAQKL